jgi:pyruvate kinase
MPTKIITTLGPASGNPEVLKYFKEHSVEIARLNGSHGIIEEHLRIANLAMNAGLDLMLDLPGPKIRLGEINDKSLSVKTGEKVIIEKEKDSNIQKENEFKTFPCQFAIEKSTKVNDIVYIDDGKLQFRVLNIENNRVLAEALNNGPVKSHKGVNLPCKLILQRTQNKRNSFSDGKIDIDFLTENDHRLLEKLLPIIKPKYVATSFVKTINDIHRLKKAIKDVLNNTNDYFPQIIAKIEMAEAIEPKNITDLINECDMIMIARGDLALETTPVHIRVPFIQADLVQRCQKHKKPFIIATQILESMITCPVPTRAEVSDLYRAVILDQANYVMLSGEAAVGQYPKECVTIMHDLINFNEIESVNPKRKRANKNI